MGVLECASYMSIFRGYDYYKEKKVQNLAKVTPDQYRAEVMGTAIMPYEVLVDTAHPRKSKCNCPHADGRRIVCKHMVAIYLTVFPDEAKRIYETLISDGMENEYDDEDDEDEQSNRVIEYVCKMKKSELQQALLQVLFDGSEWQYERFIEEHGLSNE